MKFAINIAIATTVCAWLPERVSLSLLCCIHPGYMDGDLIADDDAPF